MNKQETALTWGMIRANIPVFLMLAGIGLYINNGLIKAEEKTVSLERAIEKIAENLEPVNHMTYRMDEAEKSIRDTNSRLDNLSNTMINNVDLIRRDVNRQTTQIEVLASKLDMFMGVEMDMPKQRRSRPGGPISSD